ncbi:BQ2448_5820 [Microbotryum intermedium]|uniref:BQ2448_5820 protein n=1 Tax=Microbotryum intermedium TaxID=269621 RepID=A0A238F5S1_9BASI|nr:BQ2448_5820 [Microbotryum intermedium]
MSSSISFKIQAPPRPSSSSTAPSSHLASTSRSSQRAPRRQQQHHHHDDDDDADDDDDESDAFTQRASNRKGKDELVTAFDRNGATQKNARPSTSSPLVIAALPNKDWREAAELIKKRKNKARYIPDAVGGMRLNSDAVAPSSSTDVAMAVDADQINSTPVVAGLSRVTPKTTMMTMTTTVEREPSPERPITVTEAPQTEEQRALNELISSASGLANGDSKPSVEVIYSAADARNAPIDESDAFKRDVETRPDQSTLEDYARVPVGEFGAAMLRGMGWKPGQAASRSGRSGPVEAFVPKPRPAMLGIGARPIAEVLGPSDGKGGKNGAKAGGSNKREDMRFVPLAKKVRVEEEGSTTATRSLMNGNGNTSGSGSSREVGRESGSLRWDDRDRDRYDGSSSSSRRDRYRDDERGSTRHKERERGSSSRYDERASSSRYESSRGGERESSHRDRNRERERGHSESSGRRRDRSSSPRRESESDNRDGRRDRDRDEGRDGYGDRR